MDLRCVDCDSGYYTAARFARDLECAKCGGKLVVVPDPETALADPEEPSTPAAALAQVPVAGR
ncbi:MAG: hypothetical protein H0U25_01455 [Thermoleophilaceae bacterium]|nr:hypothetical protein [Thermoleophilaceae bacterium]